MTSFARSDDLRDATFVGVDLRGARFVESDLSGIVMRGVEVAGADIDAPWLVHGDGLLVNGVDVVAYVESELNRRFPGRAGRRAGDPAGLQQAWAAVERTWDATVDRVSRMPAGTVDVSVAGEWTFAQTLRHLVFATDLWLGRAVLGMADPHPIGEVDAGSPPYEEVLAVRAERRAMVRELLATVTPQDLATPRANPHDPDVPETTLSCLHVILEEEWEHHRFAVRDLDAIAAQAQA